MLWRWALPAFQCASFIPRFCLFPVIDLASLFFSLFDIQKNIVTEDICETSDCRAAEDIADLVGCLWLRDIAGLGGGQVLGHGGAGGVDQGGSGGAAGQFEVGKVDGN